MDRYQPPTYDEWKTMLENERSGSEITRDDAETISRNWADSARVPITVTSVNSRAGVVPYDGCTDGRRRKERQELLKLRRRGAGKDALFGLIMFFLQSLILVFVLMQGHESPFIWILWIAVAVWAGHFLVNTAKWWRLRK
jgi:hypothetical protein